MELVTVEKVSTRGICEIAVSGGNGITIWD